MNYLSEITICGKSISINNPTYFIADIASNHDADLGRAKELIWLCKEAGADAVKFQHFKAEKIVSDYGFQHLKQSSHQAKWEKSVFDVFKDYELKRDWNFELKKEADLAGIDFFTTPYDIEAVEEIDALVEVYKIGSGDITWIDFIQHIAKKNKPILLATGASNFTDVQRSVEEIIKYNDKVILMQCNTNYTGDIENFKYINLNVLRTYNIMYPNMILGLSDHTPGHATVLGAITLGARVIEKHFTDDNNRKGPDHPFSMNPNTWRDMVCYARELENSLGNGVKIVEKNEQETSIVQRRGIYLNKDKKQGDIIFTEDLEFLRPAPDNIYFPYEKSLVIGQVLKVNKHAGQPVYRGDMNVER
ncbi:MULTISPECIES: N-acetylneuraminate synthase family protein [Lysinibacillus]|jgi:N-acetylneuraminate synthase|uniref:N-acetylneuraminate synthase family protein n=1 Tax=Lysinibacillus TaxID=400634 RepID=UPI0004D44AE8|nr:MULTISPECIES: N-acetylneuraminate synthase family protein [Lysinibacillus]AJK89319.1 N-acetylneuraminate synthase [Lysinibacillus fusiformis]KHK52242.1 N-acetylneuraminate synthase [Lysinibacillus sp. A1]